jgi:hypothetical protein
MQPGWSVDFGTYESEHLGYVAGRDGYAIIFDEEEAVGGGCVEDLSSDFWGRVGYVDDGNVGL